MSSDHDVSPGNLPDLGFIREGIDIAANRRCRDTEQLGKISDGLRVPQRTQMVDNVSASGSCRRARLFGCCAHGVLIGDVVWLIQFEDRL